MLKRLMLKELHNRLANAEYDLYHTHWEEDEEKWLCKSLIRELQADIRELECWTCNNCERSNLSDR